MSSSALFILAVILVAGWFWFRGGSGVSRGAEARLRSICLGNDEQVERLIEAEMTRVPGISRNEAAVRAVSRYQRDNR